MDKKCKVIICMNPSFKDGYCKICYDELLIIKADNDEYDKMREIEDNESRNF